MEGKEREITYNKRSPAECPIKDHTSGKIIEENEQNLILWISSRRSDFKIFKANFTDAL